MLVRAKFVCVPNCKPWFVVNKMLSNSFLLCIAGLSCTITAGEGYYSRSRSPQAIAEEECQKIVDSIKPPVGPHIVGGEEASPGEFPHMVALGYEDIFGYKFDCGGSLISDRFVVTAAHCVDRFIPNIVRMGLVELESRAFNEDSDVYIERIYKHPDYTPARQYDDLALIKLKKPVEFNDDLNPACLYTKDTDPTTPLTVTGWGITGITREEKSNVLLKTNVSIVPLEQCNSSYPVTRFRKLPQGIIPRQLCAGDPNGLHDACKGDSGGPLQSLTEPDGQTRLVGVTSFGRGCGSPVPGVYTRLSHYLDWIGSIVWPQ